MENFNPGRNTEFEKKIGKFLYDPKKNLAKNKNDPAYQNGSMTIFSIVPSLDDIEAVLCRLDSNFALRLFPQPVVTAAVASNSELV